jgi:hypothetical protein
MTGLSTIFMTRLSPGSGPHTRCAAHHRYDDQTHQGAGPVLFRRQDPITSRSIQRAPRRFGLGSVTHDRTLRLGLATPTRQHALAPRHNRTLASGSGFTTPLGPIIITHSRPQLCTDQTQACQGPILVEPGSGSR